MITGEAIISYPAIWEPKENLSGVLKYSCQLLFDKADAASIEELEAEVNRAITKGKKELWNGKVPKFRYNPLRDGDAELESGEKDDPVYAGKMFLNCSANEAPQVVGPDAKPLMDQNKLYPGCIVRASINAFPYDKSGNRGIGWGLNSLMVVRDGDRLDGRRNAEDEFAAFAQTDNTDTNNTELM